MSKLKLSIKFHGIFKSFGEKLQIEVPSGTSISEVKKVITETLGNENHNLIKSSVIANEREILSNVYIVESEQKLSILPPVCGG